jgi:hypothetical protein
LTPFQLQSLDQFDTGSYPLLFGANLLILAASIYLIRWVKNSPAAG